MKQIFKFCGLIPLLFAFQVIAEDVCVKKGPCSCEFSNGSGIDLTPTVKSTFYTVQTFVGDGNGSRYTFSTYYYHPCYDAKPNVNSTKKDDSCGVPLALCRHVSDMKQQNGTTYVMQDGNYEYMGSSNDTQFSADGKSIIYLNKPSENVIKLMCIQAESESHSLQIYSLDEPDDIVLAFYSTSACLKQLEEPGRSFGSTLLIIFFSCVIFYLVLGICTKKFLMGATGVEIIPNLGFWTDLPHLVKDGWAFTVNGFKLPARGPGPVTTPDPNSYDSI